MFVLCVRGVVKCGSPPDRWLFGCDVAPSGDRDGWTCGGGGSGTALAQLRTSSTNTPTVKDKDIPGIIMIKKNNNKKKMHSC